MRSIIRDRDRSLFLSRVREEKCSISSQHMVAQRSTMPKADKECDFYQNPTILGRLIVRQKYEAASRRLRKHPDESRVWVCSIGEESRCPPIEEVEDFEVMSPDEEQENESSQVPYTRRQLPVHTACAGLALHKDMKVRRQLEELIVHLATTYPQGCSSQDHEGKLPLHHAIIHDASTATLSYLLVAAPETLQQADGRGRIPIELNCIRTSGDEESKELVHAILARSEEFWKLAHDEAKLRLKQRVPPVDDATITSSGVLASSVCDDSTMATEFTIDDAAPKESKWKASTVTKPLSFSQLKERAILLERKLAESMKENADLTMKNKQEMERLQQEAANDEKRILALQKANEDLNHEIRKLREQPLAAKKSRPTKTLPPAVLCRVGTDDTEGETCSSVDDHSSLQQMVQHLQARTVDYEERIASFERLVGSFSSTSSTEFCSSDGSLSSESSPTPSADLSACYEDRDLDTVLEEAENLYGKRLSPKLLELWNALEISDEQIEQSLASTSSPDLVSSEDEDRRDQ